MPRQGIRRVKTGCSTCKTRKVKCDEKKPTCQRCLAAGLRCDGYSDGPPTLEVEAYNSGYPGSSLRERRALKFFQDVVRLQLSGHVDVGFWDKLILQFSQYDLAVRHAVVAVGTLYEQLNQQHQATFSNRTRPLDLKKLALYHYNAAISDIASTRDESRALIICVLFICIESLLANNKMATMHCGHAIQMCNTIGSVYPWVNEYILPILRRLSIMPVFFGGATSAIHFLDTSDDRTRGQSFETLADAQHSWDVLLCRCTAFIRAGNPYRFASAPRESPPDEVRQEQDQLLVSMDQWAAKFQTSEPSIVDPSTAKLAARVHLLIQYYVIRIWTSQAYEPDETKYADHSSMIANIVAIITQNQDTLVKNSNFMFETGFIPLLHFVVMKCRNIQLRLQALVMMRKICAERENLWNLDNVYALGRRVVEIEHDFTLSPETMEELLATGDAIPLRGTLVREATFLGEPGHDGAPGVAKWRDVCFLLQYVDGTESRRNERVAIFDEMTVREGGANKQSNSSGRIIEQVDSS